MAKKEKAESTEKKGGKKKLIFIILPVLLLAAGGAYFFLLGGSSAKKTKAVALPPVTVSFPTITTNLSDGHVVQAAMDLSFKGGTLPANVLAMKTQMTNAIILSFSGWSYSSLLPESGKVQLRTQLISSLNSVLSKAVGKPKITSIYFTSFLMQ
jgi:flagellar FliL protein